MNNNNHPRNKFSIEAQKNGVTAGYSGQTGTMYVKGEDSKVKSFIRKCNLKGKGYFPFKIAQSHA